MSVLLTEGEGHIHFTVKLTIFTSVIYNFEIQDSYDFYSADRNGKKVLCSVTFTYFNKFNFAQMLKGWYHYFDLSISYDQLNFRNHLSSVLQATDLLSTASEMVGVSRLYYCNALLPASKPLQMIQTAAAFLTVDQPKRTHLFISMHGLLAASPKP